MPLTTIPKRQPLLDILQEPISPEEGALEGGALVAPVACEPVVRDAIARFDEALSPNLTVANIELIARALLGIDGGDGSSDGSDSSGSSDSPNGDSVAKRRTRVV